MYATLHQLHERVGDLSIGRLKLLLAIAEFGEVHRAWLVNHLDMDAPTGWKGVKELERRGLVSLAGEGRGVTVTLSSEGAEKLEGLL